MMKFKLQFGGYYEASACLEDLLSTFHKRSPRLEHEVNGCGDFTSRVVLIQPRGQLTRLQRSEVSYQI